MEQPMDDRLDNLLREHSIPDANSRLASRIVSAATPKETRRPTLWKALGEILRPAPVAAFACSLMLGLLASRHLPYDTVSPMPAPGAAKISQNAGAFLYYNGEVL